MRSPSIRTRPAGPAAALGRSLPRVRALLLAVAVALLPACGDALPTDPGTASEAPALTGALAELPAQLAAAVNAERQRNGLGALRGEDRLVRAAQLQANQMAEAGRMAHDLPGAPYPSFGTRIAAVRYSSAWVGENLAVGYWDAPSVVKAWMESPTHRENMLRREAVEFGVAVALSAEGRPFYALVLGRPS